MVPDSPVSSSGVGLNDAAIDNLHEVLPVRIREAVSYALMTLEDNAPYTYRGNVRRAVTAHVEELFSATVKLELARKYLAVK